MNPKNRIKVALVVPHIFLHKKILPNVIFAPGVLALELAEGLVDEGIDVTLFTPGPVETLVPNINADLSLFENELSLRGDTYIDLLKKHPSIFISLARQVQSELIADAYNRANGGEFDLVHIYTNEEDIALPFAKLCNKPVVFTHHDPFSFLIKYKNLFPKYAHLKWLSLSFAQRSQMPENTNWIANIYNGLDTNYFKPVDNPSNDYLAYFGRIIKPKGVDLAIKTVNKYNESAAQPLKLRIAGKHYSGNGKDDYWETEIEPYIKDNIEYLGFIKNKTEKNDFLANARALIVPSIFEEPFGMVIIEALASGTPVIGLDSGAIPEIINGKNGIVIKKDSDENTTVKRLVAAINDIEKIDRNYCRQDFEKRFTLKRMCSDHATTYRELTK